MASLQTKLRNTFAKLSNAQAYACYHALAQWLDNELTRDDIDEDEIQNVVAHVTEVEQVVQMLEVEFASLADEPPPQTPKLMGIGFSFSKS